MNFAGDHTAKCESGGGADVWHVDPGVPKAVAVKDLPAGARHQGTWFLRRQSLAGLPHRIFARGPIPLSAPSLKIRFRLPREKHSPCILEFDAGLVEGGRSAVGTFPRVTAGIEPASPAPRIFARRHAGAGRDRAETHVAIEHVPAFVRGIESGGGLV